MASSNRQPADIACAGNLHTLLLLYSVGANMKDDGGNGRGDGDDFDDVVVRAKRT